MAKKNFQLLAGAHQEFDKVYDFVKDGPPVIVPSDRPLVEMYPHKFVAAPDDVAASPPTNLQPFTAMPLAAAPKAAETTASDYGDDVTDDFDKAEAAKVKVYRHGKGAGRKYIVVGSDGKPVHEQELTRKDDVETLVDSL